MKKMIYTAFIASMLCCILMSCDKDSEPTLSYTVQVVCAKGWGEVFVSQKGTTSVRVEAGSSVNIIASPSKNCSFEYWTYEQGGEKHLIKEPAYTFKNVNSDMTFTAVFSKEGEKVIFEDDFNQTGSIPDPSKWELCAKGSSAWCRHMSESYNQAYVEDGRLVLVGEIVDGEYKAGGVKMLENLGFQYGRVEVSARFTSMAQGSWPAIWMMPSKPMWSGWPQCGEIDIMEHLNKDSYVWNVVHSNYVDNLGHKYDPVYSATPFVNTSEYNTYAIDWDADNIVFMVNGQETLTYPNLHLSNNSNVKQWPFDAPFYLILNNALGGAGTWPGNISDSQLPAVFEIDYVKVTQRGLVTSEE